MSFGARQFPPPPKVSQVGAKGHDLKTTSTYPSLTAVGPTLQLSQPRFPANSGLFLAWRRSLCLAVPLPWQKVSGFSHSVTAFYLQFSLCGFLFIYSSKTTISNVYEVALVCEHGLMSSDSCCQT